MQLHFHLLVTLLLSFSRPAAPEAPGEPGTLARVCREHGLRSRYCRAFALPACSFARLDRLVRRQEVRQGAATRVNSGRLRRSAWIPTVSAEWGRTDLLDVSSSYRPGETLKSDEDLGQRSFWKVRATWDLRGLAFGRTAPGGFSCRNDWIGRAACIINGCMRCWSCAGTRARGGSWRAKSSRPRWMP
jgi:hypothetical protein